MKKIITHNTIFLSGTIKEVLAELKKMGSKKNKVTEIIKDQLH